MAFVLTPKQPVRFFQQVCVSSWLGLVDTGFIQPEVTIQELILQYPPMFARYDTPVIEAVTVVVLRLLCLLW